MVAAQEAASEPLAGEPLPLTLLTGFLGAGKTTLLNSLLSNQKKMRIAALVNELGSVSIDTELITASADVGDDVVELSNGCICCTINDSLCDALESMLARRDRIDYLILETSGVSDPAPLLQTLALPRFSGLLRLDSVLAVVDATAYVDSNTTANDAPSRKSIAAHRQLALADIIVMSKMDLLPRGIAMGPLEQAILAQCPSHNPRLIRSERGRVSPELLLAQCAFDADAKSGVLSAETPADSPGAFASPHAEADGFHSGAFRSSRPLSLAAFEALRSSALWLPVVRCKGFLRFAECPERSFVLQMVGARVEVTTLPMLASAEGDGRDARAEDADCCRLVVIGGKDFSPGRLLRLLSRCEASSAAEACEACEEPAAVGGGAPRGEAQAEACGDALRPEQQQEGLEFEAQRARDVQAAAFVKQVKTDPRFEVHSEHADGIVAFRLQPWLGVEMRVLNAELLREANSQCRTNWLAARADGDALWLLQPNDGAGGSSARRWDEVRAATERVMMRHFSGYFCGGCDCLDTLAGQVLV